MTRYAKKLFNNKFYGAVPVDRFNNLEYTRTFVNRNLLTY